MMAPACALVRKVALGHSNTRSVFTGHFATAFTPEIGDAGNVDGDVNRRLWRWAVDLGASRLPPVARVLTSVAIQAIAGAVRVGDAVTLSV
jgi:hypothetical protein